MVSVVYMQLAILRSSIRPMARFSVVVLGIVGCGIILIRLDYDRFVAYLAHHAIDAGVNWRA